jgi:hypothetical protein
VVISYHWAAGILLMGSSSSAGGGSTIRASFHRLELDSNRDEQSRAEERRGGELCGSSQNGIEDCGEVDRVSQPYFNRNDDGVALSWSLGEYVHFSSSRWLM